MSTVRQLKDEIAKAQGALQTKLVELYVKIKDPTISDEERVKITTAIADLKKSIHDALTGRLRAAVEQEKSAQ